VQGGDEVKYISICSGIEAASTAWHGLGWTPLAFSEIEPFPSAVLAQRHPNVPNLGDMSKYREWPEELLAECELLVGGTPCQAFSVAGLRKSLDDERGNLSLIYVQLFHHINEIRRKHGRSPAIALWENVPGVLSTKDNAFGCFISGLLGVDDTLETQDGKWPKAGFLGSETVRVGYRVLDAQYFGVAQRRRRVFLVAVPCELVASLGERACPSEILSLRESVLGNPPTRGEARQAVAGGSAERAASGGGCGEPYHPDRAMFNQGVNAQYEPQITDDGVAASMVARGPAAVAFGGNRTSGPLDVATSCLANGSPHGRMDFASETFVVNGHPDPAYAISAGKQGEGGVFGSGRDSQDTFAVVAFHPTQDPISSVDGSTHAMGCGSKGGCCTQAVAVRTAQTSANGHGVANEVAHTLDQVQGQAVAFTKSKRAQSATDDESWVPGEVAPTQNQFDVGDTRATTVVAFTQNSRDEVREIDGDGQIAGALSAEAGMHQTNYLAFSPLQGGRSMPVTPESPTLEAGTGNKAPAVLADAPVQVQWASGGGKVENPTMQALRTSAEHSYQFVRQAMQVRRLTPTECCRLQGFPDDHCDITFRKKPAADGPKYRALGNSMAVPCMAWLGYRIHLATHRDNE
jgi:DNA (cytosine-5)-methyltransferase 1